MTTVGALLAEIFTSASTGPVLSGQLFPLANLGSLRVTYNWLYSALNCNPSDASIFDWTLAKTATGQVTLSPSAPYRGMTLYASVRPDWSYFVQVQAPNSADWITRAQGDEFLTLTELGLLTINLRGLNGLYLALNGAPTPHDGYSGYKLQANAASAGPSTDMFLSVSRQFQGAPQAPCAADIGETSLAELLRKQGVQDAEGMARRIVAKSS